MFVAPNCECGGDPEIRVVRGERLIIFSLGHGEKVVVRKNDVLFVSCAQCKSWLEFKETEEVAVAAKI
jgi:hypothetical protein